MKKKVLNLLTVIMLLCSTIYGTTVKDSLKPLRQDVETNVESLGTVIFVILGIFVVIAIIELMLKESKSNRKKLGSNKIIRFIEVTILIVLLLMLCIEYFRLNNVIIKIIGIILSLFTFYQRVSNKNRRWAYITLTLDMLLYIGINIFR